MRFYDGLNFKRYKKICMEIVAESKALLSSNFFHTNLLNFFKIQTVIKSHFFNARGFKLGRFDVFDMLFPFLAFLKLQPIIL